MTVIKLLVFKGERSYILQPFKTETDVLSSKSCSFLVSFSSFKTRTLILDHSFWAGSAPTEVLVHWSLKPSLDLERMLHLCPGG